MYSTGGSSMRSPVLSGVDGTEPRPVRDDLFLIDYIAYMFAWSVMVVNQVDAALARPAGETGTALLALPEDQWFDRKSVRVSPKDLGLPLTAFANAEGGHRRHWLARWPGRGMSPVPREDELLQTSCH